MTNEYDLALSYIEKVINEMNPRNGKCEYIKGLTLIKMGDNIGACPFLEISKKLGFKSSFGVYEQICN